MVVVGIPYPNLKDKQVELKRKYNDEKNAKNRAGVLSGDQWYSQQAFRALNQAVGRCLRHRNDHGAVLLVDERYAHGANDALVRNLPKWLRPATRKCADFDASVAGLRAFFSLKAKRAPPEAARAPPAAKLLPSVGAEKDAKERDGGGGKGGGKPKNSKEAAADARQRDIKRFFQPAAAATAAAGDDGRVRNARGNHRAFRARRAAGGRVCSEIAGTSRGAASAMALRAGARRVRAATPRARPPGDEPAHGPSVHDAHARGHGDGAGGVSG